MKETLKFILELLRPHRKVVMLTAVLAILAAALDTLGPILMGRGFDLAAEGRDAIIFGGALLLWFVSRFAADLLRSYVAYRGSLISGKAATRFVAGKFGELLNYPLTFHYGSSGREAREYISNLRWAISNALSNFVFDFIPAILTATAISIYLFTIDPAVGGMLVASIAIFIGYTAWKIPPMRQHIMEWNKKHAEVTTYGWDASQNILAVKSNNNEDLIRERLKELSDAFEKLDLGHERFMRGFRDRQNLIILIGSTSIVFLALLRFAAGDFTFGRLSAVTAYAFTIFGYVRSAQWGFVQIMRVGSFRETLQKLTDGKKEDASSGKRKELAGGVEFKNVRFRYHSDRPIIEQVSFSVRPGERVAIVGESGEGKTTLVDLIGRYYEPSAGKILLDGTDAEELNLHSIRSQMAYVPQDLTLFHDTIETNIRFGRSEANDDELQEAARLAHLDGFIASLPEGWNTIVGERGLKVSGGERQRIALARAFLRDPKILILDEPTSNLDSKTEAFIQDSLAKLMVGRTTFVIAHRLKTVMNSDRILVLKNGRIAEAGTHDELLKKSGAYAELLSAQSDRLAS